MPTNLYGQLLDGKYEIEHLLGEGAHASVYQARQPGVERPLAVKILRSRNDDDDTFRRRFELEAQAIGRMRHPGCVFMVDSGHDTRLDAHYIVMELLEGEDLATRMLKEMTVEFVLTVCWHIAEALQHAHTHGILHRDLKPENVMICPLTSGRFTTKVLDFGLARLPDGDDDDNNPIGRVTKMGEVFGTPAYMSPEQCHASRDATHHSDIYALGVMMYELLEGETPFSAPKMVDLMVLHLAAPVPPQTSVLTPEPVKELISKMLEKEPGDRPKDCGEVLKVLTPYADLMPSQMRPTVMTDSLRPVRRSSTSAGVAEISEVEEAEKKFRDSQEPVGPPEDVASSFPALAEQSSPTVTAIRDEADAVEEPARLGAGPRGPSPALIAAWIGLLLAIVLALAAVAHVVAG